MLTEQGEIIHGWAHKWHAENRKLQKAAKRVNKLRDLDQDQYTGISITQKPTGETVIVFELTPDEIKKAPKVVKRVFSDLNLHESDKASLQLTLPPDRDNFYLAVLPDSETGRTGINLSSVPKQGEILIYNSTEQHTETIPLFSPTLRTADTDTNNLLFAYRGISGNVDGNEIFVRSHPYIKRTMVAASKWMRKVIKSRRKPRASTVYH